MTRKKEGEESAFNLESFKKQMKALANKSRAEISAERKMLTTLKKEGYNLEITLIDVFPEGFPEELSETELQELLDAMLERFRKIKNKYSDPDPDNDL